MSRSTVDWVRRSSQTVHTHEKKPRHGQVQEDKQEVRRQGKRTDGVVEGLPRLLVPDEGGLSLVGHPDGCRGVTRSRGVTLWNSGLLVVSTCTCVPLMLEMSTLSCVSFSHVRSIHSYTDCRISLGSSSTHLEDQRHVTSRHVMSPRVPNTPRPWPTLHLPFSWEALLNLHLVMAQELGRLGVKHLQGQKRVEQILNNHL